MGEARSLDGFGKGVLAGQVAWWLGFLLASVLVGVV